MAFLPTLAPVLLGSRLPDSLDGIGNIVKGVFTGNIAGALSGLTQVLGLGAPAGQDLTADAANTLLDGGLQRLLRQGAGPAGLL